MQFSNLKMIDKLNQASRNKFKNPYLDWEWPEAVPEDTWYFSPELISIKHLPEFGELSDFEKKRLSFYEAVNFFSLNINGERALIQGLAQRLYRPWPTEVSHYIHHFLDEENKHMYMFGTFCDRYNGGPYKDKKVNFPVDLSPEEEDFLFFAKVIIFEEIVDDLNFKMSRDERLHPLAVKINHIHHIEESRHLAFGRQLVKDLFSSFKEKWTQESLDRIESYLKAYIVATWKEYYNPDIYASFGFESPYDLYQKSFQHPQEVEFRRQVSKKVVDFLMDHQIIKSEPF